MDINNSGNQLCCPVCTLFLREGMTLQDHLYTHPKDQVIEALVRISIGQSPVAVPLTSNSQFTAITYQHFRSSTTNIPQAVEPNVTPVPLMLNSCIIPQQFINSSSPPPPPPPPINRNQYYNQSNVIRSPIPLLPYSYYSPQHQNYLNGNSQTQDSYVNNNVETIQYSDRNITQTTQTTDSPFNEDLVDELTLHNKENEDKTEEIQESEDNRCNTENNEDNNDDEGINFINNTHNNIGTVISDTHRLITNDPCLNYDQDIRSSVEFNNVPLIYSPASPREESVSPISTVSNWSTSSGLRVRTDLRENSVIQNDKHDDEYITSDCNFEDDSDRCDGHLLNLDSVPQSVNCGFSVDGTLECDDNDNKEEESTEQNLPINIHSDELMPPRGELSGQESLGATENSVWEIQGDEERSPEIASSYQLHQNNDKWDDISPKQIEKEISIPSQNATITQPRYKCRTCAEEFSTIKERKIHVTLEHKTDTKKITQKVKRETTVISNATNSFVQVFVKEETSGLKSELEWNCPDCSLELPSLKELKKHRKVVHADKKGVRVCTTCKACFPDPRSFKEHISKVHPLECIECGKCFLSKANLSLHQKRHLKVRPHRCTICDKSFVTRQKLCEHENAHTGNEPFKCKQCDRTFKRYSNLIQHKNSLHLKIKKKIKDYFCHCGEVFHSTKKLEWHKEIHDPKPKQCIYCSQKFIHSASLTRHIRHNHDNAYLPIKGNKLENVQCPVCHQQYLKSSLAMHMKIHSGEKPFSCTTCSKEFSTKWNLQLHKWTHASRNSKPFKCKLCKSAFISSNDFQAHMRSHKNIRPYICNHCGRQFIRKYNCIRHVKEHEAKKSYICQECGKTFHRSYYLTEHMRMHTGFKPFACHICAKRSSTKSNHNKHIKTHHAREPVNTEGNFLSLAELTFTVLCSSL